VRQFGQVQVRAPRYAVTFSALGREPLTETIGRMSKVTHPEHERLPAPGAPSHGALLELEVHDWASVSPLAPRWPGDHVLRGSQRIRAPAPREPPFGRLGQEDANTRSVAEEGGERPHQVGKGSIYHYAWKLGGQ
jgi:hypothetical protein